MERSTRKLYVLHIPYRFNIEQPDTQQRYGINRILKQKCACGSSFKIIWKPLSLMMSNTLREFSHPAFFLQKLPENKGIQKLRKICCNDCFHF